MNIQSGKINTSAGRDIKETKTKKRSKLSAIFNMVNKRYNYPVSGQGININRSTLFHSGSALGFRAIGSASLALDDVKRCTGTLDCETAALIVYYMLVREQLGDTLFDSQFPSGTKNHMNIRFCNGGIPKGLERYVDTLEVNVSELQLGDWVYMTTHGYCSHDRGRLNRGHHAIVSGLSKYRETRNEDNIVLIGFAPGSDIGEGLTFNQWNKRVFSNSLSGFLVSPQSGLVKVKRLKSTQR